LVSRPILRGVASPGSGNDHRSFDLRRPAPVSGGIGTVIANDTVVIDRGEHTGALPGRLLRRRGAVLA
jgi:hypothetical protein